MKAHAFLIPVLLLCIASPSSAGYGFRAIMFEDFATVAPPAPPSGWSIVNANGDIGIWETREYGGVGWGPACIRYINDPSGSADDWAFTAGLSLTSGEQYTVEFMYRRSSAVHVEALSVFAGAGQDPMSMTIPVWTDPGITNSDFLGASGDFTVPASGTYYIGFHAESPAGIGRLYVDEVAVLVPEDRLELDLGLTQELYQTGTLIYSPGDTIECMTYVTNVGDSALVVNNAFAIGAGGKNAQLGFEITAPGDSVLKIINVYEAVFPLEVKHFSLLHPDSIMGKFIDLNEWYDMETPGEYTVEARYRNYSDPFGMSVWMGYLVSDPVIITIE
jgi:hypothetical protein